MKTLFGKYKSGGPVPEDPRRLQSIAWGKRDPLLAKSLARQFDQNWVSTLAPWEKEEVERKALLRHQHPPKSKALIWAIALLLITGLVLGVGIHKGNAAQIMVLEPSQ